jgi:uncharacterized protein YjiS (DUF1127 family)
MKAIDIAGARRNEAIRIGPADVGWPPMGVATLVNAAGVWLGRWRQRRALSLLDDRMLDDIGVSRIDAERETQKPFWRD